MGRNMTEIVQVLLAKGLKIMKALWSNSAQAVTTHHGSDWGCGKTAKVDSVHLSNQFTASLLPLLIHSPVSFAITALLLISGTVICKI